MTLDFAPAAPRTADRPAFRLGLVVAVGVVVVAAFVLMVCHFPGTTIDIRQLANGDVAVGVDEVAAEDSVRIALPGRPDIPFAAHELVPNYEPRGAPSDVRSFYQRRAQLADGLRAGKAATLFVGGKAEDMRAVARGLKDFALMSWLSLGIGFAAFLIGSWVLLLRPKEWAAWMYGISGFGLVLAALTIASNEYRSLASPAWVMESEYQINYLSAYIFGTPLVGLFCRYPKPLLPANAPAGLGAILGLVWLAGILAPWRDVFPTHGMVILGLIVIMAVLFAAQLRSTRTDPVARAAASWIGAALLISACAFTVLSIWPQLQGKPVLTPQPVAMSVFLLFYAALAAAIVRYRLFDLGRWAGKLAGGALILGLVLLADLAVAYLAGGGGHLSIGLIAAFVVWLPVRQWLISRSERRRVDENLTLLRSASLIGYAGSIDEQRRLWRQLLADYFQPLEIAADAQGTPALLDQGQRLLAPAVAGEGALVLSNASQGRRLFGPRDLEIVQTLSGIVSDTLQARSAFEAGKQTERERIARDLHDDIGSHLLTALHRDSIDKVHAAVRDAMVEMRTMVGRMSLAAPLLGEVLADLRQQTLERCEAAGLTASWPLPEPAIYDLRVSHQVARQIVSTIRELVSNAIRHAQANALSLTWRLTPDRLVLQVGDDGRGFGDRSTTEGNGLANIQRRIAAAGGSVTITSLATGTEATISLPLASLLSDAQPGR